LQALVLSVLRLMQTRADIYHASDLTALPASFIAATLRRKLLIFEVYDLHFPIPETGINFWRRLGGLLTRFHAFVLPRCVGVIATSPLHAEEICKRFSIPEVVLLRNIPAYRSVRTSNRLREYLGLGPDVRIALYQGSLQPDRELDRLIRAAPFLKKDIVIVMMGKDKVGTKAQLEELIASERVGDRIKILAPVPYEELLDWTASADIGLIIYSSSYSPNVQMCLPNKLFEFLMAGLPVLAGRLDAIANILTDYDVGQTVPSLEPASIGEAMNAMLEDQDALLRMRCNALKAVQQELNWEEESQKLIDLYADIFARLKVGKRV
jgi:glycosyltransferase involved in cell wall biosynthesis